MSFSYYAHGTGNVEDLTIIAQARMGSESIAHEAEGQIGY